MNRATKTVIIENAFAWHACSVARLDNSAHCPNDGLLCVDFGRFLPSSSSSLVSSLTSYYSIFRILLYICENFHMRVHCLINERMDWIELKRFFFVFYFNSCCFKMYSKKSVMIELDYIVLLSFFFSHFISICFWKFKPTKIINFVL